MDSNGVNVTIQAACQEIVAAFNRLSTTGVHIRDLPSAGSTSVSWHQILVQLQQVFYFF